MTIYFRLLCTFLYLLNFPQAFAENKTISHFGRAKDILRGIYADHQETFYCGCNFKGLRSVNLSSCNYRPKDKKNHRSQTVEWEHVVPASLFGQRFVEWKKGHPKCKKKKKKFKGRRCAKKTSKRFRFLESDLYNLYPAIGEVNELRENFSFATFKDKALTLEGCAMKIDEGNKRVNPPPQVKGLIGRTYLYMERTYPEVQLSSKEKQTYSSWAQENPVSEWECKRAKRIENVQGNENSFVKKDCMSKKLW